MRYIKENKITINKNILFRKNERNSLFSFLFLCTKNYKSACTFNHKEAERNSRVSNILLGGKEEFFFTQNRFQMKSNNEF